MFELDPHSSYMMPAHFGPRPLSPKASGWYRDVTSMVVPFITDAKKLSAYLPRQFSVAEEAVVTVTYACNRNIDWLAGHGYNLIAVSAAVDYAGEEDTLSGNYALVMWENLADPILTGRELQGIPKIYADIQDHSVIAGHWHSSASHFGNKILDIDVSDLREPSPEEIQAYADKTARGDHPLAWRYFPGISGFGHGVSEHTTFPSENILFEVQVGTGHVNWQQLIWEQNPTQFHIVNALAGLPVLEWLPAIVAKGSTNLIIPERLPRVIR
ncbi:MAG: acetoacetate decarboxylase [Glaciecola sp.]|jgi:acetoacetate decarboxylase|uniref:acetoacetate decarboxylase family protein n=1 Tax=Congregibacter sp. TaxID=2744308 RepID=UPI0039E56CCC